MTHNLIVQTLILSGLHLGFRFGFAERNRCLATIVRIQADD